MPGGHGVGQLLVQKDHPFLTPLFWKEVKFRHHWGRVGQIAAELPAENICA
jgi:hypothetical protein